MGEHLPAHGVGDAVGVGVGLGRGPDWAQYLPPVFISPTSSLPPQMIMSLSAHTALCRYRGSGALVMFVAVQILVFGLYLPPVLKMLKDSSLPPQTIISTPVQTDV